MSAGAKCLCYITMPLLMGACEKCEMERLREEIWEQIVLPRAMRAYRERRGE